MTARLPMDRSGLGILSHEECIARLRRARLGRLAFVRNGDPMILPVNHGMDGESVVFRTNVGGKLLAADSSARVCFEIDGADPDRRSGWSVVVNGVATTVTDTEETRRLDRLGVWPWAGGITRVHWVRIVASGITGRQIVHTPPLV